MNVDESFLTALGFAVLALLGYLTFCIRRRVMRWPPHLSSLFSETVFACLRPAGLILLSLGWLGTSLWFDTPTNHSGMLYEMLGERGDLYGTLFFTTLMGAGSLAYILLKVRRFLQTWRQVTQARQHTTPPCTPHARSLEKDGFGQPSGFH